MDSKANMMIDGIRKHVHLRSLITDIINNVFESQMGKKAKDISNKKFLGFLLLQTIKRIRKLFG